MKFLDKFISKFFIDPLFKETRDGVELSGYDSKQKYLQQKIDDLKENRSELLSMASKITSLTKKLDSKKYDLHISEHKYKNLVEHSTDIIFLLNVDYTFSYMSPALFNVCGYDPNELIGKKVPKEWFSSKDYNYMVGKFKRFCNIDNIDPGYISFGLKMRCEKENSIYVELIASPVIVDNKLIGIQGVVRDVTERKLAEQELKDTLDATTDGVWYLDIGNNKVVFSNVYYTMLGYEPGEFEASFDNWKGLIHPDDLENALKVVNDYLNIVNDDTAIYENEFRLKRKSGDYFWVHAKGKTIRRFKNGKPSYMIGCHEDINDRKIAEQKIITSEKKYRKLIDTTDTGFVIINTFGVVIDANHNYLKLTGRKSIKDILGCNVLDWTYKDHIDLNKEAVNLCARQGYIRNIELDYIDLNSNITPIDINASLITTDSGEIQILALCRNISDRKEKSIKLKESELRYKQLSNATFEAIFISKDGICIDLNEAAEEMFGISYDDAIGKRGIDFIHPDYQDITVKNIRSKTETTYESFGMRMNGEMFPCQIQARVSGDLRITALYDMTEVKKTQKQLIESEEQFRLLAENSIDIIWMLDVNLQTIYTSPSVFTETGYTPEEFKALSLEERYDEETVKMLIGELTKLKSLSIEEQKKKILQVECMRRNKNGSHTNIKFVCRVLYKNDEFVGLQGTTSNITERIKAETKLKESEKQYRDLIEYANEGVLISQNHKWVLANRKTEELFGVPEREIIGQSVWDFVDKEDLPIMQGYHDRRLKGDILPKHYTYRRLVKPDNCSKWTQLSVGIITWDNKPAHLYFISDIDEKIVAQDALKESEKQYRNLIELANDGIVIAQNHKWVYANKKAEELFGIPEKELIGHSIYEVIHKDNVDMVKSYHIRRSKGEDTVDRYQYRRLYSSTKCPKWTNQSVATIKWRGNFASLCFMSDINEKVKVQEELLKSEEQFRLLAENSIDVIWKTNLDLKTVYVSPSIEDLSGYTSKEFLELPLNKRYDEQSVKRIISVFDDFNKKSSAEQKKQTIRFDINYIRKNKSKIPVRITCTSIFEGDKFVGIQGTSTNITREREYEKELKNQRDLFDNILDTQTDYVVRYDVNKKIQYMNKVYSDLLYVGKDCIGLQVPENVIHPDDVSIYNQYFDKLQSFPYMEEMTIRILIDDIYQYFHVIGKGILDGNNKVIEIQSVGRDMTEYFELKDNLQYKNQLLSSILETQTACIAKINMDRKIIYANKAYAKVFCGTDSIEDCCNINDFMKYVHPNDIDIVVEGLDQLYKNHSNPILIEYRVIDFEGKVRFFRWEASMILDNEGNPFEIQAVGYDLFSFRQNEGVFDDQ